MHNFEIGQLVISKAGRDCGRWFIIFGLDELCATDAKGQYAALVDGALRPLARPKKKKVKHLQPTKHVSQEIKAAIASGAHIKDSDIKSILKDFQSGGING